jgi:hypothetical protein
MTTESSDGGHTSTTSRLPLTFLTQGGNRDHELALAIAREAETAGFTGIGFADRPHDPMLEGSGTCRVPPARASTC